MKRIIALLGGIITILGISGSAALHPEFFESKLSSSEENTITKSEDSQIVKKDFNIGFGKKLSVELKTGGYIRIEGWEKESVSLDMKITGEDAENVDVDFENDQEEVEITTRFKSHRSSQDCDIECILMVPQIFNIDFETMGGDVNLKGIEGNIEGTTMGGKLDLTKLKGKLNLKTMGGEITLTDSQVDGFVKTMGGEVLVKDVSGQVSASSMGGKVRQINVKRKSGESVGDEVNISTMGGEIEVDQALNGAKLKTMGGDISVNEAAEYVRAETMGGKIQVKSIDGWAECKTMGGNVEVNMTGDPQAGDRHAKLTSMGGDIYLSVPSGLSMDIDIELVFTKKHENDYKIESDFNIEQEISKEWDDSNGTPKKVIYGKGKTGDGKNNIKIKTINGNVYLKKN